MIYLNKKYISFIIGLFTATQVRILGTLSLSEFMIFFFLIYIIIVNPKAFGQIFKSKRMRTLLILCFLWICSIFFSDQINPTSLVDSLKGLGGVIPLFLGFLFFYWLFYEDLSHLGFFLWGYGFSYIISLFIFTPSAVSDRSDLAGVELYETGDYFSRLIVGGVGRFLTASEFQFFSNHPYFIVFLHLIFSFYALFEGSRSPFLMGIISTILFCFFVKFSKLNFLNVKTTLYIKRKIPLFIVFILIGGFISGKIYSYAAENGYLGEANKRKYETQSQSKLGLLSGRGEFVSAYLAIKDSPLLGHGSYAKDKEGYAIEAARITGDDQFLEQLYEAKGDEYIPTHSHITGAWVQNGILGAIFWCYALFLVVVYVFKYFYIYPKWVAYSINASLSMIWQILFSPFSNRPYLAAFFVFIILMMDQIDKKYPLLR